MTILCTTDLHGFDVSQKPLFAVTFLALPWHFTWLFSLAWRNLETQRRTATILPNMPELHRHDRKELIDNPAVWYGMYHRRASKVLSRQKQKRTRSDGTFEARKRWQNPA